VSSRFLVDKNMLLSMMYESCVHSFQHPWCSICDLYHILNMLPEDIVHVTSVVYPRLLQWHHKMKSVGLSWVNMLAIQWDLHVQLIDVGVSSPSMHLPGNQCVGSSQSTLCVCFPLFKCVQFVNSESHCL